MDFTVLTDHRVKVNESEKSGENTKTLQQRTENAIELFPSLNSVYVKLNLKTKRRVQIQDKAGCISVRWKDESFFSLASPAMGKYSGSFVNSALVRVTGLREEKALNSKSIECFSEKS